MDITRPRIVITRIGELSAHGYAAQSRALDSPDSVCRYWRDVIETQSDHEPDKETLVSILLGTRLRPVGYHEVSRGTVNESLAHPREILRPAVIEAAHGFVLVHNHPSGDPAPSEADRRLTRRIQEAAKLIQIELLDHVIVGNPAATPPYFSFREAALL